MKRHTGKQNSKCKIVKILILRSRSREHFQSKCSRERERNISILTILHLLGIVSVRSKSLSTSLKKR